MVLCFGFGFNPHSARSPSPLPASIHRLRDSPARCPNASSPLALQSSPLSPDHPLTPRPHNPLALLAPILPSQSSALKVLDAWTGQWTTHGKLYDTPYSHAAEITITHLEFDTDEEQKGKKIHIKTINDFSKPGIIAWNTKFTDDAGAHWTLMNEGTDTRTK